MPSGGDRTLAAGSSATAPRVHREDRHAVAKCSFEHHVPKRIVGSDRSEPATFMPDDLANTALPADTVGLLEGLASTRAIRRYRDEPVPPDGAAGDAVRRQPCTERLQSPAVPLHRPDRRPQGAGGEGLIATGARRAWSEKRTNDGYDKGSGSVDNSPKARMAATMQRYTDEFERVPVLVLPCLVRYREPTPFEGASIFPAVQNLLLAARGLGYGGVLTGFHALVETELRDLLEIPEGVFMAGTVRSASLRATTARCDAGRWRADLQRGVGRDPGVGRRPSWHHVHASRAAEDGDHLGNPQQPGARSLPEPSLRALVEDGRDAAPPEDASNVTSLEVGPDKQAARSTRTGPDLRKLWRG